MSDEPLAVLHFSDEVATHPRTTVTAPTAPIPIIKSAWRLLGVATRTLTGKGLVIALSQHPDHHRSKRSIFLAVDQNSAKARLSG